MVGQDRILLEIEAQELELEDQVRRQNTRIEECEREIGLLRSAKASLEGRIAKMGLRRRSVEGGWPMLVTLMQSAEGNAEKDPRGYRLHEPMRALVAVSQPIPNTSGRPTRCLWVCRPGRPGTASSTLFPTGWG
jgi:hypothetical protein